MMKIVWIKSWLRLGVLLILVFLYGCGAAVQYGGSLGARVPLGPHYINGIDCSQFKTPGERAGCERGFRNEMKRAIRRAKYERERAAYEYGRSGGFFYSWPYEYKSYKYRWWLRKSN